MTSADDRNGQRQLADKTSDDELLGQPKRVSRRPARVERFIARYGWRAYALPALTALAIVALLLAILAPSSTGSAKAQNSTVAADGSSSSSATEIQSEAVPPTDAVAPEPAQPEPAQPTENYVKAGDNSLQMVAGQGAVLGTGGQIYKFDVEVEGGAGVDGAVFAAAVEKILADPRSWTAGGKLSFQRVSDGTADFHIDLVTPDHVEGYCPGYNTNGYTSCRNGDRVVINLARWSVGVEHFAGQLDTYREYVINHEVGHYLGHGHVKCSGAGRKAPVMMQQTLALNACTMNAWPYPNGPADDPNAPA